VPEVHELALADAIVAIARGHARGRRVTSIDVKVGHLRQVVPDALDFAFQLVASGTNLDGASLAIERVAPRVACNRCAAESETSVFPLACAACGSVDVAVVAGDELLVDSLEIEDEPAFAGGR
jgi:hydrogenase nickel incorporation protein HypA/HybF